jgi:predicted ABC-type ATPase
MLNKFLSLRYFKIVCLSFVEIQFHVAYGGHNYEHEFIRNRGIASIIDPVIALVIIMCSDEIPYYDNCKGKMAKYKKKG